MSQAQNLAESRFTVACVQNCATNELAQNIAVTTELVRASSQAGARLVCLPENFAFLEVNDQRLIAGAFAEAEHPALQHFVGLAQELKIWLLLGSLTIKADNGKVNNRSYLLSDRGKVIARYDKLHLFDVTLKEGETYLESSTVAAGSDAVLAQTPWGDLGMTICYDLRFAYLYRMLAHAGARMLTIPAAFTRTTGNAHWHVLVRARAIETGCFVFAPGQCGIRPNGRATFGHSLIVDPWGRILAEGGDDPGFICSDIDTAMVSEVRNMVPSLQHDRSPASVQRYEYLGRS